MPQIFRPRSNPIALALLMGAAAGVVGLATVAAVLARSDYATGQGTAPQQPVPFSHKHHAGSLGIDCRYCHTAADDAGFAGVPPTHTCMTCHSQLWTNAEMLAPVRHSLAAGEPLHWQRVHDLPDFVYFDHRAHINNGVGCESCHGRVDRMALMRQHAPLTMQWCLDCHRDPAPRLRPPDRITAMGYDPAQGPPGHALMQRYGIDPQGLTNCTTCHR